MSSASRNLCLEVANDTQSPTISSSKTENLSTISPMSIAQHNYPSQVCDVAAAGISQSLRISPSLWPLTPSLPTFIAHEIYPNPIWNASKRNLLKGVEDLCRLQDVCIGTTVEDNERIVRTKQKRLLLIRHASRCNPLDKSRRCKIPQQCAATKQLLRHIKTCVDARCTVSNCRSTRYVITHYRKCQDVRCPVCIPVKKSIERSTSKEHVASGKPNANERIL